MRSPQTTRPPSPSETSPSETPIDSLPDELLCEIFGLVQHGDPLPTEWCRVLWVCHRWSVVGRAAALLWCDITIGGWVPNKSFIVASLEYSQNTLLTININPVTYLAYTKLSLLSPHIHRIRSLKISSEQDTANDLSALATFLNYPFPSLEIFKLQSHLVQDPLIWQPNAPFYPRLCHLILEGSISIKVAPTTVFPGLRGLRLSHNSNPSFTIQSFTQFLSRHPSLKELELFRYNIALDCPSATLTFPPAIQSFSLLGCDRKYVKHFLSSFAHIPAHVSLYISGQYDEYEPGNFLDRAISTTDMLPDSPQHHLRSLSRVTSVEITGTPDSIWSLVGYALLSDNDPLVEFDIYWPWWPTSFSSPRQLVDVVGVFYGAPVVEVRLTSNMIGAVPKAEWIALFDAFPMLEHVAIEEDVGSDGGDARDALLEALSELTPGGGPRWPRLKRFTLVCQNCTASFISLLPRALQVRAEQDAKVDQPRSFVVRAGREVQLEGSEVMDKLVPWIEEAMWKSPVKDTRLDFELT